MKSPWPTLVCSLSLMFIFVFAFSPWSISLDYLLILAHVSLSIVNCLWETIWFSYSIFCIPNLDIIPYLLIWSIFQYIYLCMHQWINICASIVVLKIIHYQNICAEYVTVIVDIRFETWVPLQATLMCPQYIVKFSLVLTGPVYAFHSWGKNELVRKET